MAGGGGAWKVAYADFVTAMMAFFLVMWITGQSPQVKQSVAGYFQDPWGTSSENSSPASLLPSELHGDVQSQDMPRKMPPGAQPGAADSDEKNKDAQAKSHWSQKRKLHFVQDADHALPALVLRFDEASAELTDQSKEQIDRLLPSLLGKAHKIEIRGHSTRRPLPGDSPYHDLWELCYARCAAVMEYLEQKGVEADRLRLSQSAAFEPLTNRIEATWQGENSRVELFMLNEMADEVPGAQNGAKGKTGKVAGRVQAVESGDASE